MDIPYVSRSRFLVLIEECIGLNLSKLNHGEAIHIELDPGGYSGDIFIKLSPRDRNFFVSDWEFNDPSRFPARIRAAATALRNSGLEGVFRIRHKDGTLEIKSSLWPESGPPE